MSENKIWDNFSCVKFCTEMLYLRHNWTVNKHIICQEGITDGSNVGMLKHVFGQSCFCPETL